MRAIREAAMPEKNLPEKNLPEKNLIVIGNGMVGHKFLERMVAKGATETWNLITFCEEPRVAYDRVHLSEFFTGKTADDLSLVAPDFYPENTIQVHLGDKAVSIDRTHKTVTSAKGLVLSYDHLVLATGSYPFVPPIQGKEAQGTFVYRTIEDLEGMAAYAQQCKTGVVIGGGLLGLECANALKSMGLATHVVEFAPRLMPVQIDELGGAVLRDKIEAMGVGVHVNKSTTEIVMDDQGRVCKMLFADGSELQTDMIVFSAGIRPRDELARASGLEVGDRGNGLRMAVLIDKERLRLGPRAAFGHRHCFGRGGRFVQQAGIGNRQPGQIGDHGLIVQQRLQPTLCNLGLIGGIGGVPRRIFKDIQLDRRRRDRAVIALPDQTDHHPVLVGDLPHPGQQVLFRERGPVQRSCLPDRRWHGFVDQRVNRPHPDSPEHLRHLVRRRPDVAAVGKIVGVVGGRNEGHLSATSIYGVGISGN